jgi:hypothetical protein
VKRNGNDLLAVPFYERPMTSYQSSYGEPQQAKETKKLLSTTADHFGKQSTTYLSVASQNKPLLPYNPLSLRSRMPGDTFK